jgi:hypothetical protein
MAETEAKKDVKMAETDVKKGASMAEGEIKDLVFGIIGGISTSSDVDSLFEGSGCALMKDFG